MIDVRITLPFNILRNSGLLLHAKHCSGAIVRFSDNSSLLLLYIAYEIVVYSVNNRGPHGRLDCFLLNV